MCITELVRHTMDFTVHLLKRQEESVNLGHLTIQICAKHAWMVCAPIEANFDFIVDHKLFT